MCTSRTFLGSALAISCTLALATLAAAQQPTAKEPPKAPEGWVVVEEDVFTVFADEPEHRMKAAAFVKLEAARAAGEAKRSLVASATELEKLAGDVEKGAVTSVEKLDSTFAHTAHALATHHHKKAEESWARRNLSRPGIR
jgi:hypothetical protein